MKSDAIKRITSCSIRLPLMCVTFLAFWLRHCQKPSAAVGSVVNLGDNCIQNFHSGRYVVGNTVGNLV